MWKETTLRSAWESEGVVFQTLSCTSVNRTPAETCGQCYVKNDSSRVLWLLGSLSRTYHRQTLYMETVKKGKMID